MMFDNNTLFRAMSRVLLAFGLLIVSVMPVHAAGSADHALVALGEKLFFDKGLSQPAGQACASCHDPVKGFADPAAKTVSAGANPALYGNRNAPSIAYVKFNPALSYNAEDETYVGGFFLDGRAGSLEEQAKGPLLNPLEMGNADAASVTKKLQASVNAQAFEAVFGKTVWSNPEKVMDGIAQALVAFEKGEKFATFSSKYDAYLRGQVKLTALEEKGLEVFKGEKKGNCAACHIADKADDGTHPLLTDFTYDNLGGPKASDLIFYTMAKQYNPAGKNYIDNGLADNPHVKGDQRGKFKVPTLRNIAVTGPYLHNGAMKELRDVVEFYNERDVKPEKWGAAEVSVNVNKDELGDLKLSKADVDALMAFMKTLTDGYQPIK